MHFEPLISDSPLRVSYRRGLMITLLTLIVSQVITAIAIFVTDIRQEVLQEIIVIWFALAAICSTMVAFPMAMIFQRERLKLARAMKQLEEVHAELARRARLDPLTGILNRDAFLQLIETARNENTSGAMLMVDVDRFKTVNDTYGHLAGDDALQRVARAISGAARAEDIIGRVGGEEFAVFVPGKSIELARLVAERIRLSVGRIEFRPRAGVLHALTASVGVAQGSETEPLSDLFHRADTSLYEAKGAGRNRVMVHDAA